MSNTRHHHGAAEMGVRRLAAAIAVNVLLTAVQVAGGVLSGSLALVADALHNFSDAGSLVVALIARWVAGKPADKRRTFGYRRAEVIGALINLTTLILVGLYLIYSAIARWFDPQPIGGWMVVAVGGLALVVDLATAGLTWPLSKGSLNIRAAFVHNVADALGSVAVIVVGTLILLYGLYLADVIATLAIAGYVLYQGYTMMGQSIRILMESVPPDVDFDRLVGALRGVPGVVDIHHVHAWQLDEHHRALEAHVVIARTDADAMERIKRGVRAQAEALGIAHCTLEIEFPPGSGDVPDHDTAVVPRR